MAAKCKNLGVPFAKSFANLICIEPSFPFSFLPLPYLSLFLFVLLQHSNAWQGLWLWRHTWSCPKHDNGASGPFRPRTKSFRRLNWSFWCVAGKAHLHRCIILRDKSACFCRTRGNHAGSTGTPICTPCKGGRKLETDRIRLPDATILANIATSRASETIQCLW